MRNTLQKHLLYKCGWYMYFVISIKYFGKQSTADWLLQNNNNEIRQREFRYTADFCKVTADLKQSKARKEMSNSWLQSTTINSL